MPIEDDLVGENHKQSYELTTYRAITINITTITLTYRNVYENLFPSCACVLKALSAG